MTALVPATLLELITHSQELIDTWGNLAMVTRVALKPKKCYAYFLIYHFTNKWASLGDIDDLPTPSCLT
jgi:hypothetical protein